MAADDRCDLCGYRSTGTFSDRLAHLRRSHPAYARGLLLRMAAPFVFLVLLFVLAAVSAPRWAYGLALLGSFGLLVVGKRRSRAERSAAGARARVPLSQIVREGGLRFILILPAVAILLVLLAKR